MILRGLVFLVGFLLVGRVEGAVGKAEGKSVRLQIEAKDRVEAVRVASASAGASDLFDELTKTRLLSPLEIRGQLEAGGPVPPVLEWDGRTKCRIKADPQGEDFAAAWVSTVISARILAAAQKREGSASIRWLAEGCTGRAMGGDEAMEGRVAAAVARLDEASLSRIQLWPEQGELAADGLTRDVRRLLASRLVVRAVSSAHRLRLEEWVAVGCPGKFWSDTKEEDGAWRRSLAEPERRSSTEPQSPEETVKKLRELAAQVAKATVRGNQPIEGLEMELLKLEATADPFLRPAIFRYRQAVKAGDQEKDRQEREAAMKDADVAVGRWREMRGRAEELLDWYEINVPDARMGPGLREWDERLRPPVKKEGRPTGFEPATARITIWSSTS